MATKSSKTNKSGAVSKKKSDTHIGTIEKKYGKDYGVRSDLHLGTYLRKNGYSSLSALLKDGK